MDLMNTKFQKHFEICCNVQKPSLVEINQNVTTLFVTTCDL